jgi:Rrf2 family protein
MRLSEGVEWGIHAAALLAAVPPDGSLPSARLAEYHGVPAAYMAKHLQALSRAGIVESVPGRHGGYRLARPAEAIRVLDVVEAVEGPEPAFRCTEIRRRGPARVATREYRLPCAVHALMLRADAAWRKELAATTVADLLHEVLSTSSPTALRKGAAWIEEVVQQ